MHRVSLGMVIIDRLSTSTTGVAIDGFPVVTGDGVFASLRLAMARPS